MHNIIKNCIEAEARAIMNIPADDTFVKAIDVFYHHVHEKGGKLVVSGMGKAGQIADNIATTFSSTGTPAIFLHPANAQHGDLGILCKNDVLLLISNSGKTREIIELVELAHNLHPEIPIVVITGNTESPLASIADIAISTGNPTEVCPLGLTPTTSTTTMTVIGDILVVLLMKKINFTAADYSKRHHGGYLGDRSRDMDAGNVNKK
jgi:arabinose-5-phosphate isomerase